MWMDTYTYLKQEQTARDNDPDREPHGSQSTALIHTRIYTWYASHTYVPRTRIRYGLANKKDLI